MAADMVEGLAGAWPVASKIDQSRAPMGDPLNAIARVINRPAADAGPLSGKTIAIKDNIAVANIATALGSGLQGFVGDEDATIVARIAAAGCTISAKSQCEAFLLGANSFSSRPEPVRNPHDLTRSAGGSSSGSAAMVAAGLSDCAIGTDSGGSIRIPASHCGIVGFKPSRGVVPYTGIAPLAPWLEVAGPMARSVADAAALFEIIAGSDTLDIRCGWAPPVRDEAPPRSLPQIRFGVFGAAAKLCEAEVQKIFDASVNRLQNGGAEITHFDWPDFEATHAVHLAIYLISDALNGAGPGTGTEASDPPGWREWRQSVMVTDLPAPLPLAYATGLALRDNDPGLLNRAIGEAIRLADKLDHALGAFDAILLPTCRTVAPLIPAAAPSFDEFYGDTMLTAPFNATGHPALSLPAGKVGRMPVGLQIVGRRGSDRRLMSIATLVENALGRLQPPEGDFGSL